MTEAFPWNEAPRYLIRDRDRIFGAIVTRRLRIRTHRAWRRMRRALAPFSKLELPNHTQSSADFITNTSGFSFRYTHRAIRGIRTRRVIFWLIMAIAVVVGATVGIAIEAHS